MGPVCFDSHVIIWGIKEQATPGQEEMVTKTKTFLEHLDKNGIKALIPSVVVAELLMCLPRETHAMFCNLMHRHFIIPPFDLGAASHFARIWRSRKGDTSLGQSTQGVNVSRNRLKVDCMIVATAVARGASCIYSHDKKLQKFAEGHIEVREIPTILNQLGLL